MSQGYSYVNPATIAELDRLAKEQVFLAASNSLVHGMFSLELITEPAVFANSVIHGREQLQNWSNSSNNSNSRNRSAHNGPIAQ